MNQPSESEGIPEGDTKTPNIARRRLLQLGGVAVGGAVLAALERLNLPLPDGTNLDAPMAKSGITFNARSEVMSQLGADLQSRIDAFTAAYESTGEIPDQSELNRLYLDKEWLLLLYAEPGLEAKSFDDANTLFEEHEVLIRQLFDDFRSQEVDPNDDVRLLVCMKSAIRRYMDSRQDDGEAKYVKQSSSVYDPIFTGKYQCRSATQLALLLLRRWNVLSDDATLVNMYPNHHVFPAILKADQAIQGVEMTTKGASTVDGGTLPKVTRSGVAVRIVRADHAMAQSVMGKLANVDDSLLANSVTGDVLEGSVFVGDESRCSPDVYGWAEPFSRSVNPDHMPVPVDGLSLYDYHGTFTDSVRQRIEGGASHITYYVIEVDGHEYKIAEGIYPRPPQEPIVVFHIPAFADANVRREYQEIVNRGTEEARAVLKERAKSISMTLPHMRLISPDEVPKK